MTRQEIETLIGGRYKSRGFTTTLSAEMFARAGEIVAVQPWARTVLDRVRGIADFWAAKSDAELYALIPTENPRAFCACYSFGCPVCGTGTCDNTTLALRTSLETPNRWQCVTCGRWFGPDAGIEYGGRTFRIRDDGAGWKMPDGLPGAGHLCYFVAAWRQYLLNVLLGARQAVMLTRCGAAAPVGGLGALATMYALEGGDRYAHKALLILIRLAELHPGYNGVVDIGSAAMMPHLGWTTGGAEDVVDACVYAYDVLFDFSARDADLLAFFRAAGHEDLDGDGHVTSADLRHNVAVNLFGCMYEWLLRVRKVSEKDDWTVGQCRQMLDIGRLLEAPHIVREALTGQKGFRPLLVERTLNDGRFVYNSLHYHFHKPPYFGGVLLAAAGYCDGEIFRSPIDLFGDASLPFDRLVAYAEGIMCDGRVPGIGDQHVPRAKVGPLGNEELLATMAMLLPRYPRLALHVADKERFLSAVRDKTAGELPHHVIQRIVQMPAIERVLDSAVCRVTGTRLFTDSGLAILRTAPDIGPQHHVILNYGLDGHGHSHHDQLALNILAHGYELTINKGYPYTWTGNRKVPNWIQHTAAQNVVRIDGANQEMHPLLGMRVEDCAGRLHAFADTAMAAIADGSNEPAYPGLAELYRRAVFLIKDPDHPFIVDIFSVAGGTTRDYQFHAQSDPEGRNFEIDLDGRGGLARIDRAPRYIDSRFMRDLAAAACPGAVTARWWIGDEEGTGLVLHMVPGDNARTVITGKGQGEGGERPVPCDVHVTVREEGAAPSQFVSVIFPYSGKIPDCHVEKLALRSAAAEPAAAVGLRVCVNGTPYLVFYDLESGRAHTFLRGRYRYRFQGSCAVLREHDDVLDGGVLCGGTTLELDDARFAGLPEPEGRVVAVDTEAKAIVVEGLEADAATPWLLRWRDRPWVYWVVETAKVRNGLKLHLDTFSLLDKGRYPMVAPGDRVCRMTVFEVRHAP